jgi:hypothetical protein
MLIAQAHHASIHCMIVAWNNRHHSSLVHDYSPILIGRRPSSPAAPELAALRNSHVGAVHCTGTDPPLPITKPFCREPFP